MKKYKYKAWLEDGAVGEDNALSIEGYSIETPAQAAEQFARIAIFGAVSDDYEFVVVCDSKGVRHRFLVTAHVSDVTWSVAPASGTDKHGRLTGTQAQGGVIPPGPKQKELRRKKS